VAEPAQPARVDFGFRARLAEVLEGNRVSFCYQCGACTGDCPSARYDATFNPREIMLQALYGLEDELLGDDSPLWRCSNCYTCAERCPQEVKPVEVIIALKNLLARESREPEAARRVVAAIRKTGRSTQVTSATARRRQQLELPPLPDPPLDELRRLAGNGEPLPARERRGASKPNTAGHYAFFPGCMIPVKYPQMEAAIRRTLPALGLTPVDLPEFSCCPDPIYFKSTNKLEWLSFAARNLAVAEEAGVDIFTICSGCTATLSEAHHLLADDEALREQVNERLARVGRRYEGRARVRHLVTVLRDEVGIDAIRESVTRPLEGVRVAVHYGCHLLKPRQVMQVDDPDDPVVLDELLAALGCETVEHRDRLLCCGKACHGTDVPADMLSDLLDSALECEADCLGVICPTCFDAFDVGQLQLARARQRPQTLPAVYFFQLLALAQGAPPEAVGLDRHRVKPEALLRTERPSGEAAT
jgi:heterodisulfide reductase subunit B